MARSVLASRRPRALAHFPVRFGKRLESGGRTIIQAGSGAARRQMGKLRVQRYPGDGDEE